jgi:hypothetical protein
MILDAMLAAVLLSLCAAVIALLLIWGNRWVRGVTLVLLCVWGYHAQWWARFAIDARWVDDARSRYQQDAVIAAIKAGRTTIPLAETTNFAWTAVCYLSAGRAYPLEEGEHLTGVSDIMREVLGTERLPMFDHFWNQGEYSVLVYATPDGPYIIAPFWQRRFEREFQRWPAGRYYARQLYNKGYLVIKKIKESPSNPWDNLCFKPEDVWIQIVREPAW